MNVRMMPPQGPMGQPMPMGGAPAPMGGPMGPPPMPMGGPMGGPMPVPPMQPTAGQQNKKGLGSTFGGNAQGRGQFKNFMSAKKQTSALVPQMQPSMQPMSSAPPMAQPTAAPQPMLPGPAPQMMGAMRPMGNAQVSMPIQAGRPMRGSQGGLGSAPVQLNMGGMVRGYNEGGSVDFRFGKVQNAGIDPITGAEMFNSMLMVTAPDGTESVYRTGNFRNQSDVQDDLNKMAADIRASSSQAPQVDQMKLTGFAGMGPTVTEQLDDPEFGGSTFNTMVNNNADVYRGINSDALMDSILSGGNISAPDRQMDLDADIVDIERMNRGGEVEIPRRTDIYGQDHMLAYIRPDEAQLLKGLGGMGTPGPGGVPQFGALGDFFSAVGSFFGGGGSSSGGGQDNNPNAGDGGGSASSIGSSGYTSLDAIANQAVQNDSGTNFSYMGQDFDNVSDYHNAIFGGNDDGPSNTVTTTPTSYVDTSSLAGISDASGFDYTGGNTGAITTNYDGGYDDAAYPGGSQAGFYNDGGFGNDTDSEKTDSDTVSVVTGSSGYPSLDATAGNNVDDTFGTGNIFTETETGGSTVDFGTNTETETTFPDDPPPSVYVPPPTYYDMFGGEHDTQEAANAADKVYSDAQETAVNIVTGGSDGIPGYFVGDTEYQGPDIDLDQGQQQSEASNNTAKLTSVDYSTISDDYSTFQGNDLSTGDGNTIGYSTGGSKVGYSAVVNPVTGGIDIVTPGSESIEKSFSADELTDALNYLTDGDVDLTNLDAPVDLLAGSVTGTETGDIDLEAGNLSNIPDDALDFVDDSVETDLFGDDDTPTSAQLAAQLEELGLTNVTSGPLSVEEQISQYDTDVNLDTLDAQRQDSNDLSADLAMEGLINTGALDDTILDLTFDETDMGQLKNPDGTNFTGQYRGTSYVDGQPVDITNLSADTDATSIPSDDLTDYERAAFGTDAETFYSNLDDTDGDSDTKIVTEVTGETGQTGTQAYLSAMTKLDNPETMTLAEQQALYGARGQTPNAAETAYLNALLRDAKHKEDGPIGEDGNPIYEAGDYVVQQTGAEQFGDLIVKGIDFFLNPLTILGDKYSLENMNEAYVQEQLDAYKNGGTFVYDGAGTVVGIADANYDADGDGQNDSVVLIGDDGEYTVSSGRVGVDDVNNSNQYSDTDEDIDDIDIVDSNTTYTNTEDGVITKRVGEEEEEETGDETFVDPCPEGFVLDPVLGECVPIDEVDTETGTPSLGDVIRTDTGSGTSTSTTTPASGEPMIIRGPKQFSEGGEVEMYDMTVGPNESIGNDMVMLTFPDGTKGQTQKAFYEAANSLGAFEGMETQKDFADWHMNEWASKSVRNSRGDPDYIAAADKFNTDQIAYNNALMGSDPKIAQSRMAFVQQHAPDNQAAIDAAQSLVDQYSGAAGAGIAGAGVNNMGADNTVADNTATYDPYNNYMSGYPTYDYSEGMGDDDAEIIDEFDYEKMIEELNLPLGSMILRTPKQFNVGGAVTPNIDRFMQSLGV